MNDPLTLISTRRTPQSEPDPAVADRQTRNAAGGYAFQVSDETKIHRFLTLGTTGGTYYTGERELTKANAEAVLAAAQDSERALWLVQQIAEISTAGRAPKQNPAIFALAVVAGLGDERARKAALTVLPDVCRTGTHLFQFATYVEQFRGWGGGLRRAVARWYLDKSVDDLAYQAVKYRQREGWSHRDLLRLAHPDFDRAADPARSALFDWIVDGVRVAELPNLVHAFAQVNHPDVPAADLPALIADYPLSWEMLPDAARTPEVWKALIKFGRVPLGALLRQLPTLTRLDVFDDAVMLNRVIDRLTNPEQLRKARVHPVNVLVAQKTYASGRSLRGDSTWTPHRRVVDALDEAFYASFGAVQPTNKRMLIALDVSGSMTWHPISGMPITPREASAALALVTLATEPAADVVAFTGGASRWGGWYGSREAITEVTISPRQRLDDAVRTIEQLPAGPTDVALPYLWAAEKGRDYDAVIIFTDNESWIGKIHPHQALADYRRKVGHDVRQAVVAMTATDYSVGDPLDPHSLDVAGFDAAVPNLLADFARGDV